MEFYAIGRIVGCFGIRGHVKIQPTTHSPERFNDLRSVYVGHSEDEVVPLTFREVIIRGGIVVAAFETIGTRTDAEKLRGAAVYVPATEAQPPPDGAYFVHEIIGCDVLSEEGELLGTVVDVYKLPAQDAWLVRGPRGEHLLPVVREIVKSIDTAGRKIIIHRIEGLLEE